jgi:parvulin-like peptidyl-prolyl isomerase
MVPEFEEAVFGVEAPGVIEEPVQTSFGYHVIEVLDQTAEESVRVRHILLGSEEDAASALTVLTERDVDFAELAAEFSLDQMTAATGGDLGFIARGTLPPAFEEAAFAAEVGEVVGPIETQQGFHVIEVVERGEQVSAVEAQHILVETEEEAQEVFSRLEAGEDFGDLAAELSIDPSAGGHGGDTRLIFTNTPGYYARAELGLGPDFDEQVFGAEPGEIVGPIETFQGVFVIEVQDFQIREPNPQELQSAQQAYAMEWQEDQLTSDRVQQTDLWQSVVPSDPAPTVISDQLEPLADLIDETAAQFAEFEEQTRILNLLRNFDVPDFLLEDTDGPPVDGEVPPFAEETPESAPPFEANEPTN